MVNMQLVSLAVYKHWKQGKQLAWPSNFLQRWLQQWVGYPFFFFHIIIVILEHTAVYRSYRHLALSSAEFSTDILALLVITPGNSSRSFPEVALCSASLKICAESIFDGHWAKLHRAGRARQEVRHRNDNENPVSFENKTLCRLSHQN